MSESFVKKNVKLSLEFDAFLAKHPDIFESIPNGAYVIITVEGDDKFNTSSISMVRRVKSKRIVEAHKSKNSWKLRPLTAKTA